MHDIAGTSTENGMELVFAAEREAGVAPVLVAREAVSKVPAPRTLADVARKCPDVPNLRCRDSFCSFRQHCVLSANQIMPAQGIQSDETADGHTATRRLDLI